MKITQKLYAYVDESGQDTLGAFFVVGIIVLEQERERILAELTQIENETGKGNAKWHKSRSKIRQVYMQQISQSALFEKKLFFEEFTNSKQYLEMASYATAKAILKRAEKEYTASIFVDGLTKGELGKFERGLRDLRIKKRKVRGVRKEENDAFIRLADSICGLVRDARDGTVWAVEMLARLKKRGIVTVL